MTLVAPDSCMCDEGNAQPAAAHAPHSNEIH